MIAYKRRPDLNYSFAPITLPLKLKFNWELSQFSSKLF